MPLIRKDADTPKAASINPAEGLTSASSEARWSAARQLAKDPSAVPVLQSALSAETDPRVREALFSSLAHLGTPDAIAAILPHIRAQDAALRAGALDALNTVPGAVERHIPTLLADPDPDVRLLICDIVRRLPSPVATRHLCTLLERESVPNVCGGAVEALSEVGDETALPCLADCAQRFASEPFLVFAIQQATNRIAGDGRNPRPV